MRELRRLSARTFENKHVLVSVREMVLAADDVADTEVDVVGAGGEVVGWHAVGAEECEVFDVVSGFDLLAVDASLKRTCSPDAARNTEAEGEGTLRPRLGDRFRRGKVRACRGLKSQALVGSGFFVVARVGGGKVAVS